MKAIEYTFREDERKSWGEGPWLEEVDKRQWLDSETGLPCLIVRGPSGAWCGYVGVPEGHPLFEVHYGDIGGGFGDLIEAAFVGEIGKRISSVVVHGGLTFSDFCASDGKEHGVCHVVESDENDRVWWLGFDCGHYDDYVPRSEAYLRELGHDLSLKGIYRTERYVTEEVQSLARQLKAIGAA